MSAVVIEPITGSAIEPYLSALAELRIRVFREFPYLYAGTLEYEHRYLATYAASSDSLVVIARDGDHIVGAATAMPLVQHSDDVAPPLIAAGFTAAAVCYFGESVLDRPYRGQGIGHAFFDMREAHARAGGFRTAAFCVVERAVDHPRRPADYVALDAFWIKRGYMKRPGVRVEFAWQDLDDSSETPHPMVFWTKDLRG